MSDTGAQVNLLHHATVPFETLTICIDHRDPRAHAQVSSSNQSTDITIYRPTDELLEQLAAACDTELERRKMQRLANGMAEHAEAAS